MHYCPVPLVAPGVAVSVALSRPAQTKAGLWTREIFLRDDPAAAHRPPDQ